MEGPTGTNRPETAGRRTDTAGAGGGGVREWQKNTWFGPAPVHSNPFDEPEDAPELKSIRSENVNQRVGDFWAPQQPGTGYHATARGKHAAGTETEAGKEAVARRTGKRVRAALITAAVLAAVILVLRFTVFNITEIRVTGNVNIPASEIIRASGIRVGDNILTLDEHKIEQRITSDFRLRFRYLGRQLPHTVVISVREREACCWITYCGILYVMDKNRMVLAETEEPGVRPAELVEVKGLEIRSNTVVGQIINLGNTAQQAIFSELFLEMKVLGCTGLVMEADISNPGSILLTTRDGYTVSLGNGDNMHAKLRSMLLVREELRRMQMSGGTINVSVPETPIYTPAS